jgi:hypothetical protein
MSVLHYRDAIEHDADETSEKQSPEGAVERRKGSRGRHHASTCRIEYFEG